VPFTLCMKSFQPFQFYVDVFGIMTKLVSVNMEGTGAGSGAICDINANGRFVLFNSEADNLVPNDSNGESDVFVRDLLTGTTELISINRFGNNSGNGGSDSRHIYGGPKISADGRFAVFESFASDLVENDTNEPYYTFVRDMQLGITTPGSDYPDPYLISADGRFRLFRKEDYTDNIYTCDLFVRDLLIGTDKLVSVDRTDTKTGNGNSCVGPPVISDDGRFVAFMSKASDLVENDANGKADIFVRDLQTENTTLISVNWAGTDSGNEESGLEDFGVFSISAHGRIVAFMSCASDLVRDDNDGKCDIFVRPVP
jgi:Tol biopolymer transport system component